MPITAYPNMPQALQTGGAIAPAPGPQAAAIISVLPNKQPHSGLHSLLTFRNT